jgi:hypothetical protein
MEETFQIANEIEHLASRIIDRNTQAKFRKGFEGALKESQASGALMPIHEHLRKGLDDPYNFGVHLGYLVGFLRFHPREIIESNDTANHFLESLESLKRFDDFHHFAKSKMQSWNRKIRPHFKELEEAEKRAYMMIMKVI